ncbi:MAG: hypothetical protein ABMA15_08605 [Vicinamibacterales bacterium]
MSYHHRVRGHRVAAVVLLLGLFAGTLFDRCLFACEHDTTNTASTASCHHDAAASDDLSIHGVALCDHDHQALLADAWTDVRSGTRHDFGPALAVVPAIDASSLQTVGPTEPSGSTLFALTTVPAHRQLRL